MGDSVEPKTIVHLMRHGEVHNPDKILYGRLPGFRLSDDHLPAATVSLVQVPAMAISSTECRERVAAGMPIWYLVPDGVVQYIAKRQLYR